MSKIIKGNVVDALLNKDIDYLLHCCNCQNNFGSGIAKEIKERVPSAYDVDKKRHVLSDGELLGHCSIDYKTGVVNIYAQEFYGYYGDWFKQRSRQVNYGALSSSLMFFINQHNNGSGRLGNTVGLPYKFGSDRAGGDWDTVKEIVEEMLELNGFDVVWYKL